MTCPKRNAPAWRGPGRAESKTANQTKLRGHYNTESALFSIDCCLAELLAYALATDAPDPRTVDAADHLDAARELLAGVRDG